MYCPCLALFLNDTPNAALIAATVPVVVASVPVKASNATGSSVPSVALKNPLRSAVP